jgi:hypothetical protein
MTLFLDTSALVRRYRQEDGTALVLEEMDRDLRWFVSALIRTEAELAFCVAASGPELDELRRRLASDLDRCHMVPVDHECLARAAEIGCGHGLRMLDALHLAAADRLPRPVRFLSFDRRQAEAGRALGFEVTGSAA